VVEGRVAEMRRRLGEIHRLAEQAARRVGYRRVEELLDMWVNDEIATGELRARLAALAGGGRRRRP